MWLNPESMSRWMYSSNCVAAHVELNPVVGGTFRIDMQEEDGRIFAHTGQYLAIERPHKLVFTWNSTVLGDQSSLVTVEFREQGENCLLVLRHDLPPDEKLFEEHRQGWTDILDLLAQRLKR
jgi:uncharacterized protein YndB with AHSA1/START domain